MSLPSESSEQHAAHGPNWTKWLGHLAGNPIMGLELGCWKGESAEWMLDHIFTAEHATYCTVDTFEGSVEHRDAGIDCTANEAEARKRLERFGKKACVYKGYSSQWMKQFDFLSQKFDVIYIDAAHDAMNVLRDSVLAFEMLNIGGIMIWDDYAWTVMGQDIDCPKLAIDGFLSCYARQTEVLGMGWQVAVRKTA